MSLCIKTHNEPLIFGSLLNANCIIPKLNKVFLTLNITFLQFLTIWILMRLNLSRLSIGTNKIHNIWVPRTIWRTGHNPPCESGHVNSTKTKLLFKLRTVPTTGPTFQHHESPIYISQLQSKKDLIQNKYVKKKAPKNIRQKSSFPMSS
jgi:hypothetical protein